MTWKDTQIETITKKKLKKEHDQKGIEWYATYVTAKSALAKDILPFINQSEPNLTDHGPRHVADVLFRAGQLLGETMQKDMTSQDLYALILSILFHDVGNIFNREAHQQKIQAALKYVWPIRKLKRSEYLIITKAVLAHCGSATDGSKDTLKEVEDKAALEGLPINLREIAAITKLADELAEGPQRTSAFMLEHELIGPKSKPYHDYAFETQILIDRASGRIALTYDIEIETKNNNWEVDLQKTLEMIYDRIIKLDQERQYTKYYCKYLAPFKKTTVSFNFHIDDSDFGLNLTKLILTDLKVPGDKQKSIIEHDECYEITKIIDSIKPLTGK